MRALRVLLAILVLTLGLLVPGFAQPHTALAAEPVALVTVRLDSIDPALPSRKGTITITGKVTNITKGRLFRLQAYFWRSQAPITDREDFDDSLASASNDPFGARYIPSYDDLFTDANPYLKAGASASFTLKVKVADLALSPTQGIYLMGVHVLQNGNRTAVGRARIFVPVVTSKPRNMLKMTSIVVLSSRPSLVRKGVFSDDHLAKEVGSSGRLDALLQAANQPAMSYAIDPALIEELQTMKNGYEVLGDDGTASAGTGQSAAARWLDGFSDMASRRDGYRLLYGSDDVAALAHAGRQQLIQQGELASRAVTETASLPLLVFPASGAADEETVAAAATVDPAAVLLSDTSAKGPGPLLRGLAQSPIVSYTNAQFGGGPGPEPSDTAVHLQQRILADSWIEATSAAKDATLGRVRVISTAAQARGDDKAVDAPWMQRTTLTQLLDSKPAKWTKKLHYSDKSRAKELSPQQLSATAKLAKSFGTYAELLVEPAAVKAAANAALARASSLKWRAKSKSWRNFINPQQAELDNRLSDAVKISATRRITTTGSRVSFPITIRNTLPASLDPTDVNANAVKVRLDFTSANSQRLTIQSIDVPALAAGQNFTGTALVDARTNGTVRVTARLTTASGLRVGAPLTIDVTATQAGTVGWFIAIGAGIVLVGTTALRIRQVAKERARTGAALPAADSHAPRPTPEPAPETLDV